MLKPDCLISPFLDMKNVNAIACCTIGSRLDYCNSLLAGVMVHNIARLQNNAATVVCRATSYTNPNPLPK